MTGRPARWLEALRAQLWPVPTIAVVLAVVLGAVLPGFDAAVDGRMDPHVSVLLFSGGPEAAASVLQAIAGSLITVTSLTFSLTVVTLQLASSQFSPRLLRTFTSDRIVHATLALFLASFAFALTVLRSVRREDSARPPFVPEISVTVAFVLAIASVLGLVLFLAHLTREIRVETMMQRVVGETQSTVESVYPVDRHVQSAAPQPGPGAVRIASSHSGFLVSVDRERLLRAALDTGTVLQLDCMPGSFLVKGVPFATAWPLVPRERLAPQDREGLERSINAAVIAGGERTHVQDVAFGLRQLVDVAVRALSPGINDPTTAVHIIGHLSVLLCQLADRSPGPAQVTDEADRIRVVIALPDLADLLGLCLDQPRHYGASDPAVAERLLYLLQEFAWCDRQGAYSKDIHRHLARLNDSFEALDWPPAQRQRLLDLAHDIRSAPPVLQPGDPAA